MGRWTESPNTHKNSPGDRRPHLRCVLCLGLLQGTGDLFTNRLPTIVRRELLTALISLSIPIHGALTDRGQYAQRSFADTAPAEAASDWSGGCFMVLDSKGFLVSRYLQERKHTRR